MDVVFSRLGSFVDAKVYVGVETNIWVDGEQAQARVYIIGMHVLAAGVCTVLEAVGGLVTRKMTWRVAHRYGMKCWVIVGTGIVNNSTLSVFCQGFIVGVYVGYARVRQG